MLKVYWEIPDFTSLYRTSLCFRFIETLLILQVSWESPNTTSPRRTSWCYRSTVNVLFYRSIQNLLLFHVRWEPPDVLCSLPVLENAAGFPGERGGYLVLLASALLVVVQHVLSDVLPLPVVCRHVVHALLEALVSPPAGVEKQPQHQHWGVPERVLEQQFPHH